MSAAVLLGSLHPKRACPPRNSLQHPVSSRPLHTQSKRLKPRQQAKTGSDNSSVKLTKLAGTWPAWSANGCRQLSQVSLTATSGASGFGGSPPVLQCCRGELVARSCQQMSPACRLALASDQLSCHQRSLRKCGLAANQLCVTSRPMRG